MHLDRVLYSKETHALHGLSKLSLCRTCGDGKETLLVFLRIAQFGTQRGAFTLAVSLVGPQVGWLKRHGSTIGPSAESKIFMEILMT